VDFGEDTDRARRKSDVKRANEVLLTELCDNDALASLVHATQAIDVLGAMRSKGVKQTSKFRGDLVISPKLGIPVWAYTKTTEQRLPSMKKLSVPGLDAGGDTCQVCCLLLVVVHTMTVLLLRCSNTSVRGVRR